MPDSTLSAAIKEAYASCPTDSIVYHTLEIWHPNFSVPIRVVRDRADLTATLEATAPRNPGEAVLFIGYAFNVVPPEVENSGSPRCTIEIDNVSRDIITAIDAAMTSTSPVTCIYRQFLSDDLAGGPENDPPLTLTALEISATVFRVRAVFGFDDLVNRQFPRGEYAADRFPGLVPQ